MTSPSTRSAGRTIESVHAKPLGGKGLRSLERSYAYGRGNTSIGRTCTAVLQLRSARATHAQHMSGMSVENGEVLTGKGPYGGGGGRLGVPGVGTRDPRHGLGGPYTRKRFFGTQAQIQTQRPQYAKKAKLWVCRNVRQFHKIIGMVHVCYHTIVCT